MSVTAYDLSLTLLRKLHVIIMILSVTATEAGSCINASSQTQIEAGVKVTCTDRSWVPVSVCVQNTAYRLGKYMSCLTIVVGIVVVVDAVVVVAFVVLVVVM